MNPGGTVSKTFTVAGTYRYYCRFHGAPGGLGMSGVITVQAAPYPLNAATPDVAAGVQENLALSAKSPDNAGWNEFVLVAGVVAILASQVTVVALLRRGRKPRLRP